MDKLISISNVSIEIIEYNENLEPNEEMVKDLISVVTGFLAKLYGARGGKNSSKP